MLRRQSASSKPAYSTRFNLLLLEDGEYFLDDFSVMRYLVPFVDTPRKVQGRLKICTRGFFFVPQDLVLPILRFPFRSMTSEPFAECFLNADPNVKEEDAMYLTFQTGLVVEMKERGLDHPYVHKFTDVASGNTSNRTSATPSKYIFTLLHSKLDALLAKIHIIYEVAKLPRRSMTKADEERLLAPVLAPRLSDTFDASLLLDFRERLLLPVGQPVDRIVPLLKYPGNLMLTDQRLYFQPAQLNTASDPVLNWEYANIQYLYKRRYLLRQTGLEICLNTGESFFFSFKSRKERDNIYALMVEQPDLHRCQRTDLEEMMRKWQRREVSNFEYLMFLNNASGRTFNDLTQYPVFPWIVSDYTSKKLDLCDSGVYRDLSKPIGALNPGRLEFFRMRYELMPRGDEAEGMPPPFLYGTHYSTPGYVLYFLVRMAPEYMLCLQNGKFDAADRLFRSIQVTWEGCTTNHTDVKELIPEFFDLSVPADQWLNNNMHLDLGTTQSLDRIGDVELPPWANNDPNEFIRLNREALESDYVSDNLHHWIDLIFGYKQQGDQAIAADNLFYYLSYEGSVDLENVSDPVEKCSIESQIQEFGQTPKQLFATPHPSRNENEGKIEVASVDLLLSPRIPQSRVRRLSYPWDKNRRYEGRRAIEMNELDMYDGEFRQTTKLHRPCQSMFSLLCAESSWTYVPGVIEGISSHVWGISGSGKSSKRWNWRSKLWKRNSQIPSLFTSWCWKKARSFQLHSGEITSAVLSKDESILFTTCKDSTLKVSSIEDGSVRRTLSCELALSCCDISPDEQIIFIGCWDNRVYMYSTKTGQAIDNVIAHYDGISAICALKNRFLTSSWDSTIKLWRYTSKFIIASPIQTFMECEEGVLCLDASCDGKLGAAGTRNGRVYLFDLHAARFHREVVVSPDRRGDVSSVSFTADSASCICMTLENELLQFNLEGEKLFSMMINAPGHVRCFESDGEYAVGGTTNGNLFFWKLHEEPGNELIYEILKAHDTIISALVVSSSGSTIVTGAVDGSIHVWKLRPKRMDLQKQFSMPFTIPPPPPIPPQPSKPLSRPEINKEKASNRQPTYQAPTFSVTTFAAQLEEAQFCLEA